MTKPGYPRSKAIGDAQISESRVAYVSKDSPQWAENNSKLLSAFTGFERSHAASRYRDYSDLAPHVSGRPGLTRSDYDAFRPDEATPKKHKDIVRACNVAYKRCSIIRNVIDLMGDFACQGIRLTHRDKKIEQFYQSWFKKVNGVDRSERFLNNLYRTGNVVIRKQRGKITVKVQEEMQKSQASPDFVVDSLVTYKNEKREIPWIYTFLDPATISVVGGSLSSFVGGEKRYAISMPNQLRQTIMAPKTEQERALIGKLPNDIKRAAQLNKPYVLEADSTMAFHYKKDDWEEWACPMIYSLLDHVVTLEKLQLADNAALDGAISNIRIFTIGDHLNGLAPSPAAAQLLADILQNHTGVGTLDLIWGSDLKLQESNTNVHNFLGNGKYEPTLNFIYVGLGIPPTLTGTGGTGTTNNYVSLKTLVERLEYGRSVLNKFWENELAEVQRAMGHRFPATIEYDMVALGNEDVMMQFYLGLADRNMLSHEAMQRLSGQSPKMEEIRIKREEKARSSSKLPVKASPFHDANHDAGMKKLALQSGIAAPSEVGVQLNPRKAGEKSGLDIKQEQAVQIAKQKGVPGQGRAPGKKDSKKRKAKTFKPKTKATIEIWAADAQKTISDVLNPGILANYGKKNMRSLTSQEAAEAEHIKFAALCNLDPFVEITQEKVLSALNDGSMSKKVYNMYTECIAECASLYPDKQLSIDDQRRIQASVYASFKEIDNG